MYPLNRNLSPSLHEGYHRSLFWEDCFSAYLDYPAAFFDVHVLCLLAVEVKSVLAVS
jgi:hypothetical protein